MSELIKVTRAKLHEKMMEYIEEPLEKRKDLVLEYLKEVFLTNGNEKATNDLTTFIRTQFFAPYVRRWRECSRNNSQFLKKYNAWLEQEIVFPEAVTTCRLRTLDLPSTSSSSSRGRPSKKFEESSEVIKRRKTEDLRKRKTSAELSYATAMKLREEGDKDTAKLLIECTTTTPTRGKKVLQKWKSPESQGTSLSPEEALSLLLHSHLSKNKYSTLRKVANLHGHDLYPSYHKVLEAKKNTYPTGILITEIVCEVPLQNLLNKTCESILKMVDLPEESKTLQLICKWGFDGSSGFSVYKQISQRNDVMDESLFVTSIVPLRLIDQDTNEIMWKNPKPSSTRFCRPLRLQWLHETDLVSQQEESYINNQISDLVPFIHDSRSINFSLALTMVDGKVCNALADTSTMRCYICNASISQMNEIKPLKNRLVQPEMYRFGLSVLHSYIRFFECILHISYRVELKTWKVPKSNKGKLEERKKLLQNSFRQRMGLIVDVPKQGFGTSNDGNTARRFFANPKLAAEITGVDEELITRFGVILKALNSGCDIKYAEFNKYCLETAERYIHLYDWYYMPPSVHKILIHGADVIQHALLPIGELSEEAQEAKNKDIRRFREHHTRKSSKIENNEDLFKRLLLSSDPYLSSFHPTREKTRNVMEPEVLSLLIVQQEEDVQEDEDIWSDSDLDSDSD